MNALAWSEEPRATPVPSGGDSMASALAHALVRLGVTHAYGVTGSAIVSFTVALSQTSIEMISCRHESGAAFAATEASLATGRIAAVFTTAGPGLSNALTGMLAARWEGAYVVLVSGATSTAHVGRWAVQETRIRDGQLDDVFRGHPLFHYAATLERLDQVDEVEAALAAGAHRVGGFTAHLSFPANVQGLRGRARSRPRANVTPSVVTSPSSQTASCARLLATDGFAIWVGFGARHAASEVRALAERTGARVICSPRAKGIFPESHPHFVGVTGVGGHDAVAESFARDRPAHVLALGTRLGEATSLWSPAYLPTKSFIHVDVDPLVFGAAYPCATTLGIEEDVRTFVLGLMAHLPSGSAPSTSDVPSRHWDAVSARAGHGVRPRYLIDVVQRRIVESTPFLVMAECGNTLLWTTHHLRFDAPGRFRVSPGWGSMGHMATGVVGAALARQEKAVALVGDGAMLMQSEVSTAVQNGAGAVWIVLNDSRYGIVEQGMRDLGWTPVGARIAAVDFATVARGLGCAAVRVTREEDLEEAIAMALAATGPFVVDVVVTEDAAPLAGRQSTIAAQLRAGVPR